MVCTAALVSEAISSALQQLFGYIGGAVLFEVVDADAISGRTTVLLDQRCTEAHCCVFWMSGKLSAVSDTGGAH